MQKRGNTKYDGTWHSTVATDVDMLGYEVYFDNRYRL